jgi:hypothetical protein
MSTTVQPVKTRQRFPYIKIENTEFVYYYDNEILYFKSGADSVPKSSDESKCGTIT